MFCIPQHGTLKNTKKFVNEFENTFGFKNFQVCAE